jgi:ribosome-binding protein aMBF1 (putative translation factor)
MANRFKKSVSDATDNTSDNIQPNAKDDIQHNVSDSIQDNIISNTSVNILDDILKSSKKDRGKNHTLYLSAEVGDALDNQAKQSGMSKSELVDKILRKVLLNQ